MIRPVQVRSHIYIFINADISKNKSNGRERRGGGKSNQRIFTEITRKKNIINTNNNDSNTNIRFQFKENYAFEEEEERAKNKRSHE